MINAKSGVLQMLFHFECSVLDILLLVEQLFRTMQITSNEA